MKNLRLLMSFALIVGSYLMVISAEQVTSTSNVTPIKVGTFDAEVATTYSTDDGLSTNWVWSVAATPSGDVYAGTRKGLFQLQQGRWISVDDFDGPVKLVAVHRGKLLVTLGTSVCLLDERGATLLAEAPPIVRDVDGLTCLVGGERVLLGTSAGLFELEGKQFVPVHELNRLLGDNQQVRQVAFADDGRAAVAAQSGLYLSRQTVDWHGVHPRDNRRGWAPHDVRGVAFDRKGQLWFASPQGVGCQRDGGSWSLYTGYEGLPYNDFTTVAVGEDGAVWFGTNRGAIRFDGTGWNYRRGRMWLPDDRVHSISITPGGDAWFATPDGLGVIHRKPMTLAEKARFFEAEIDKYHRRTPLGYVLSVSLQNPGDKSNFNQHDSDNDGLWTSMYGAGECFAYAATGDPKSKERATRAFEAARFLSQVTQGGAHPAPPGFPARTILPASAGNPNQRYTPARDRERQQDDPYWKVIVPRWPLSEDGKWYWKTDTSSDELDGHYFLYATYHDLVAETVEEKQRVRDVVTAITDHLIEHDYQLVDHDGKPTRWARYSPELLNGGELWVERGLNSLSMLSYLKVAEHVSGDRKYRDVYNHLIEQHHYDTNTLNPKLQNGPGSGNHSDDEMAFMCYYNLFKYEDDPKLREKYNLSLRMYWGLVEPEMCPLFNFIFAASFDGTKDPYWEGHDLPAGDMPQSCLDDAVDCLKRYPLERINWGYRNSHRIDVVSQPPHILEGAGHGHHRNGKVLPIDERFVGHWNHDPWDLDSGGNGMQLCDGTSFLLPYYMGLHCGFIAEKQ